MRSGLAIMLDWTRFLFDLATGFIDNFAHAVREYPLPTCVVAVIAFAYYLENRRDKNQHDMLLGSIVFVVAVFAANVVGWIFNIVLAVFQKLFGWTEIWTGAFGRNPVAFIISLSLTLCISYLVVLYKRGWKLRGTPIFQHAAVFFTCLLLTYISTNIYAQLHFDEKARNEASASPARK